MSVTKKTFEKFMRNQGELYMKIIRLQTLTVAGETNDDGFTWTGRQT